MSAGADCLVGTLAKLATTPCVSFRGCAADATCVRPGQVTVIQGLLSTSRNLDVATDGGTVRTVYAVTGRGASRSWRGPSAPPADPKDRPGGPDIRDGEGD